MSTRLHTQDPTKRLTYLGVRQRAIRAHLLRRLTEKQYRRVALLYGFDGEPMSQREVAEVEGVSRRTVRTILDRITGWWDEVEGGGYLLDIVAQELRNRWLDVTQEEARGHALMLKRRMGESWRGRTRQVREAGKLSDDGHLWLLWVVGKHFVSPNLYIREDRGSSEAGNLRRTPSSPADPDALASAPDKFRYDKETKQMEPIRYPDEREVMHVDRQWEGRSVHSPRPGDKDAWETDRFHPESRYDRQVDELNEKYETGQITRIEWEVELLLAYVEDQNPKASELDMDDLRQEIEWVFGGQELGVYSEEKTQQLMSRVLRPYVNSAR